MSIIAVHGLPLRFSLAEVVKALAKVINGHFEALNFKTSKGKNKSKVKTCYLRLSEKLDPVRIVEKVNDFSHKFHKNFRASIPDTVPDVSRKAECDMKTFPILENVTKIKTEPNIKIEKGEHVTVQALEPLMRACDIKKEFEEDIKEVSYQDNSYDIKREPQAASDSLINRATGQTNMVHPNEGANFSAKVEYTRRWEPSFVAYVEDDFTDIKPVPNTNVQIFYKVVEPEPTVEEDISQGPQDINQLYCYSRAQAKRGRKRRARIRKTASNRGVAPDSEPGSLDSVIDMVVGSEPGSSKDQETGEIATQSQSKPVTVAAPMTMAPAGAKPRLDREIPLGTKPKRIPLKLRMALRIPDEDPYHQVLSISTEEIMTELQAKYPGLQSLCKTTGNKLTKEIGKKIFMRVEKLAKIKNQDLAETCFKMTRGYRRAHPHFGDFQFVLSTLHALQDASGIPRSQLQETDLTSTPTVPHMLDMSKTQINKLCNKYIDKIVKRMSEHIMVLDSNINPTDSEDEIARKQVREELKKLNPYLPDIVNVVVLKHFMPKDGPYYRVRIYGEPFLPNKETMHPFMSRYKPVNVMRSSRMYNMIKFNVPPAHFHSLMAMNGTVLNGAKLMICSSDVAKYNRKHAPIGEEEDDVFYEDIVDVQDQKEDWNEAVMEEM